MRTSAFGTWGSSTTDNGRGRSLTHTAYTAYAGGINCGNRLERSGNFLGAIKTTWAAGPCKYAFPAGTEVAISALPSSSTESYLGLVYGLWVRLFNTWTGSCTGTTSECSVTMSADRAARATWGLFSWDVLGRVAAATPVFAADGSLSYSVLTVAFVSTGNDVKGTPQYTMQTTFTTGASATARETAARRVTACRGPARHVGRRLEARCTPTPALAAALRKGTVRVTTRWYLRAPRQKATYPLGQSRAHLSNRRAGAVTG